PGRYRYHDLVRLYARSCAERDERPEETEGALSRLLDFYLATVTRVYALTHPGDPLPRLLEPVEHQGLSFAGRHEALDWLYTEAHCVLAFAREAIAPWRVRRVVDLVWAVKDLAESGAHLQQYESAALAALAASRSVGDARAQGRAHTVLSSVHLMAGRYAEADEQAEQAAQYARRADDPAPLFRTENDRGVIAANQGRHTDAERHLRQAIESARTDDNEPGEADALCNLSKLHLLKGDKEPAIDLARRALEILDRHGLTLRLANAHYTLGVALTEAGRHEEALEQLHDALDGFEANRQRLWQGTAHYRIAQAHLSALRAGHAAQHAEQALALGFIGGDQMRARVLITLSRALSTLGQADRARACRQEALILHEQQGPAAEDIGQPAVSRVG
ncbi:tetratricopeptide repeat protein, partial [Streptomyces jumonjinensis]